jgi:cation transport protein ChaC
MCFPIARESCNFDSRRRDGEHTIVVRLSYIFKLQDQVYGIAYKINEHEQASVINHLDYREKGGYERTPTLFYPKDKNKTPFEIIIYVANNNNPQYAGPADVDSIANQIVKSVGPSGTNVEYIFNLAKAMRDIAPEVNDEHLFTIEKRVQNLLKFDTSQPASRSLN